MLKQTDGTVVRLQHYDTASFPDHDVPLARPLTSFQSDILSTVLYFDIFHHPVSAREIYTFLPSNSSSPEEIHQECQREPLASILDLHGPYFHLRGAGSACVVDRRKKEKSARKLLRVARLVTSFLRHVPYVRSVMISGELSKGVSSPGGDIDFLIITRSGRLWLCRTILIALKKVLLLNSKRFLCLNHLVSEESFRENLRNMYTAMEIATLIPLHNSTLLSSYRKSNAWVQDFFPNLTPLREENTQPDRSSLLQRIFESLIPSQCADWADDRLLQFWRRTWDRRYRELSPKKRQRLFRSDRSLSTAYGGDCMDHIIAEYRSRLRHYRCPEERASHQISDRAGHD